MLSDDEISTEQVSVGTTVKVLNVSAKMEAEYAIVGSEEADPWNGKISSESPVGTALLGAHVGETVTVELPVGTADFTVLEIRR